MTCNHHVSLDNGIVTWQEIIGDPSTNSKLVRLINHKLCHLKAQIEEEQKDSYDVMLKKLLEQLKKDDVNINVDVDPYEVVWNGSTVGEALDKLFGLDLSGTVTEPREVELGKVFHEYTIFWNFNKALVSLVLRRIKQKGYVDEIKLSPKDTDYTFDNITNTETWEVIGVTAKGETCKLVTGLTFKKRWYYGTSSATEPTNKVITNLSSGLVDEKTIFGEHIFDCSNGAYIYYAFPDELHLTYDFVTNGMADNAWLYDTIDIKNEYGRVDKYRVFRNLNLLHGYNIYSEVRSNDWY